MIPNYNLKHAIENWCRQHNISLAALAERNVAMAREQSSAAEEMPSVLESDSLSRWATCRLPSRSWMMTRWGADWHWRRCPACCISTMSRWN